MRFLTEWRKPGPCFSMCAKLSYPSQQPSFSFLVFVSISSCYALFPPDRPTASMDTRSTVDRGSMEAPLSRHNSRQHNWELSVGELHAPSPTGEDQRGSVEDWKLITAGDGDASHRIRVNSLCNKTWIISNNPVSLTLFFEILLPCFAVIGMAVLLLALLACAKMTTRGTSVWNRWQFPASDIYLSTRQALNLLQLPRLHTSASTFLQCSASSVQGKLRKSSSSWFHLTCALLKGIKPSLPPAGTCPSQNISWELLSLHINHPRLSVHLHLAQGWRVEMSDRTETCHLDLQPWSCQGNGHVLSHLTWFSGVCILHPHSHQRSPPEGASVGNACLYNVPKHEPPAYHLPQCRALE